MYKHNILKKSACISCIVFIVFLFIFSCKNSENNKYNKKTLSVINMIDNTINESKKIYNEIQNFINLMFDDSINQVFSIYCSAYRIAHLQSYRFTKNRFEIILKKLFQNQDYINYKVIYSNQCIKDKYILSLINKYFINEDCHKFQFDSCYKCSVENYRDRESAERICNNCLLSIFTIPLSVPYRKNNFLAGIILNESGYDEVMNVYRGTYFRSNKILHNKPSAYCSKHYLRPFVNSDQARNIEIQTFGEEVVRSFRRLQLYKNKLPLLENQSSNVLSFEAILMKMKNDIKIDLVSPEIAVEKIAKYENFLNKAVETISISKKDVSVEQFVGIKEVENLLVNFDIN